MPRKFKAPFICRFEREVDSIPKAMAGESIIVLVHNEDNTLRAYFEIEAKDLHFIFPNNELETYWLCKVEKDKYISQINQVEDQKWQTKKSKL